MDKETIGIYLNLMNRWLYLRNLGCYLVSHKSLEGKDIAIYGNGKFGQRLTEELLISGNPAKYIIDKNGSCVTINTDRYTLANSLDEVDVIVVTVIQQYDDIERQIKTRITELGFDAKIISIETIINDLIGKVSDEYII